MSAHDIDPADLAIEREYDGYERSRDAEIEDRVTYLQPGEYAAARRAPAPVLHTARTAAAEALASARQRRSTTEHLGDAMGMPRGALWDTGAVTFTVAADYCSRVVVHAYRDDPYGHVARTWVEAFELLTERAMRARRVRVERLECAA